MDKFEDKEKEKIKSEKKEREMKTKKDTTGGDDGSSELNEEPLNIESYAKELEKIIETTVNWLATQIYNERLSPKVVNSINTTFSPDFVDLIICRINEMEQQEKENEEEWQ